MEKKLKIEKWKQDKGITLVALVITVIVLLILAGISITLMIQSGLFGNAQKAIEENKKAQAKEEIELAIVDLKLKKISEGKDLTKEDLLNLNNGQINIENVEEFPIEVQYDQYKFEIDENYKVTYVGIANGPVIKYVIENEKQYENGEVTVKISIKSPLGIGTIEYPKNNENIDETIKNNGYKTEENGKKEKEINYRISKNGIYTFKVVDIEGNETIKNIIVKNIDKLAPMDFTISLEKNGKNIKIIAQTQDTKADEDNLESGMDRYTYHLINENNVETTYETNEITNLADGTYRIYVIAYDKAGNEKRSVNTEEYVYYHNYLIKSGKTITNWEMYCQDHTTGTITYSKNSILFYGGTSYKYSNYHTVEKIDLTGYSKIKISGEINNPNPGSGHLYISTSPNTTSISGASNSNNVGLIKNVQLGLNRLHTIDISNLTGEYYIGLCTSGRTITIQDVWFE